MELTRHRNKLILHNKGEMANVVQLSDICFITRIIV
jgi:hypothetical protein